MIKLMSLRKKVLLITINISDSAFLLWNTRGVWKMNHTILKELEDELTNYFKPFLNAPATIEEIQFAESEMGISFPDELRNLYLAHNGEDKSGPGLFFGLPFLSLDEVLDEWRVWKRIEDDEFFNFDAFSIPTECIRERYVNHNWIPISKDYGGNNIGIDIDPDEKGEMGQVINFGRDEEVKYVIANRISDLLLFILQTLKNKNFTIHQEEDYIYWGYGANDNIHFLDALFNIELPVLHPQFIFQSENNVKDWYDSLDENWRNIVGPSERADKFIREKRLYLGGNEIKDLTGLERMNSLKKLYLVKNPVQDLTPILHLQHLQEMNIKNTRINNLSALVEIASLKKLDISHTSIQDFSLLPQFKKLESLTVHISNREQLYAISKVDTLKHLYILGLENVSELDLLVLQKLNKLITIEFENSIIVNFNCLKHNSSIQNIKLTDTKVKDGTALGKMKGLKELELDGATIDNLKTICCSRSLEIFTGSFEQFYMLKDSFERKIDFSKIIGGMSDEEREVWHQHVMD